MASITLPEALALFTKHVISVLTVDKCVLKQKSTEKDLWKNYIRVRENFEENRDKNQTHWEINLQPGFQKNLKIGGNYGVATKLVPEKLLKHRPTLPLMCAWAPIQRNVIVGDEITLHHVPYIADEVVSDGQWHYALMECYDEGYINDTSDISFTDDLIAKLVDKLIDPSEFLKFIKEAVELRNHFIDFVVEPMTKHQAFQLIKDQFPKGEFTVDNLKERYNDYKAKFQKAKETVPNIDGVQGQIFPSEQAMHSFQTLFCRRCCLYDCIAHTFYQFIYRPAEEDLSHHEPCGINCFLNIETVQQDLYISKQVNTIEYPKISPVNIKKDHWTFSEKTLFNVFLRAFQLNFCRMARTFGDDKTCAEVYLYWQSLDQQTKGENIKQIQGDQENIMKNRKIKQKSGKMTAFWSKHADKYNLKENGEDKVQQHYRPCEHDGFCSPTVIGECCVKRGTFCEKFCNCNVNCDNRFPGCNCRGACNTNSCPCRMASRECDPDLCKTCGAAELGLLQQREKYKCTNVSLQRGFHKHLLLGRSEVSGWGVFLNGSANKDELISEYCGETISQDEADRRGKVYDKYKSSFLFNLNSSSVIDAKRKGNKIRFANHSQHPNCKAKVKMVNGDSRIGIFANRNIEQGEELFFDYRYGNDERLSFVAIERPNPIR